MYCNFACQIVIGRSGNARSIWLSVNYIWQHNRIMTRVWIFFLRSLKVGPAGYGSEITGDRAVAVVPGEILSLTQTFTNAGL